jgi:hypothetical protein
VTATARPAAAQLESDAGCSVNDRESPWMTLLTGTWRARPGLLAESPDHLIRRHLASPRLGTAAPGPLPGQPAAPRPALPFPPPNPIAAAPGDGRVLSSPSSRVHEPGTFTEAAAQRSQTGLTGSGSHRYFYGGFGGGHSQFQPHACGRQLDLSNMGWLQRLAVPDLLEAETTVRGWWIALSSMGTCCGRLVPPTTRCYFVGGS